MLFPIRHTIFIIGLMCGFVSLTYAQKPDTLLKSRKDSLTFTKLKTKMYKTRVGREIYGFLFRDIYNQQNNTQVAQVQENPFKEYEHRVIRKVIVKKLQVFGESVYDTAKKAHIWTDRLLNRLHTDTREGVIRRSYLLFQEGDILHAQTLWDNERLLRSASFLHDARILVIPDKKFPNQVDVLVLTQDVWSLEPIIDFGGPDHYSVGLAQRNFRGLGHTWQNTYYYNRNLSPHNEYQSRYFIPYIGNTFASAEATLNYFRDLKQLSFKTGRTFLVPNTKWAGNLEMNHSETIQRFFYKNTDSLVAFPLNYNYMDAWLGRSFRIGFGNESLKERARIVIAARSSLIHYTRRPEVREDTNRLYSNRITHLFSIGFSNRRYTRDLLIYGYGRTEDVPYGYLASVVGGWENTEFGHRNYWGLKLAHGQYLRNKKGYLYGLLNIGGYQRMGHIEQGIASLQGSYFSQLIPWGHSSLRHFVTVNYIKGYNRFDNEYISIANTGGIRGLNSSLLRGTQKLAINLESVCFSPLSLFGFRMAFYGFVDIGWVTPANQSLIGSTPYQGYGVGLRLRNENFTFNTISIRLSVYPNAPVGIATFRPDVSGEQVLRLPDFIITQPEVIPFR
jgi:hypothetical protein